MYVNIYIFLYMKLCMLTIIYSVFFYNYNQALTLHHVKYIIFVCLQCVLL